MTDFLIAYAALPSTSRLGLCFENVDLADTLDQEFLSVLLRRADPEQIIVRVCSSSSRMADSLQSALKSHAHATFPKPEEAGSTTIPQDWRAWLKRVARGWAGEWAALNELSGFVDLAAMQPPASGLLEFLDDIAARLPPADRIRLASKFVESDCTSGRLVLKHVYASASAGERKALHRARAAVLEASNPGAFALGSIPFHYEQASLDVEPLLAASKRCMHLGYYDAALDWAIRGRTMVAPHGSRQYNDLTRNALFALLLLGRFDEVEAMCDDNMAHSTDPALLAHTTYARAILMARLYDPSRRDFNAARTWIEKSLGFTEMLPPSDNRVVNLAFLRNTLALVEMRTGGLATAYELLTRGLDYIAKEAPGKYKGECVLLLQNRARLQVVLGQVEAAIADLTELLRHQRNSEAYLERGVLYQRAGKYAEALRDYDDAIRWSPPYPEPHFNRAQTLVASGRPDEALVDYDYVLTLAPEHIEALTNRGCLLYHRGEFGAARSDAEAGLRINPRHARLLCLHGLLELRDGNPDTAKEDFTGSIREDPSLADAWANRATLLLKRGDAAGALLDLTHALTLREDADALYNRGRVHEVLKRWAEAIDDYSRALKLATGDVSHILTRLRLCRNQVGAD